jgi:hypothetical protein
MCRARALQRKRQRKLKRLPVLEFHRSMLMSDAERQATDEQKRRKEQEREQQTNTALDDDTDSIALQVSDSGVEESKNGQQKQTLLPPEASVLSTSSLSAVTTPVPARVRRNGIINDACSICLDDFTDGVQVKVLPCRHAFHTNCIDEWLTRSDQCPVDRETLADNSTGACDCQCCC